MTVVGNVRSSSKDVSVGVLQGNVLGPLLFIIYINELSSCPSFCEISLYTDNTIFYCSASNINAFEQNLNIDLQTIASGLMTTV